MPIPTIDGELFSLAGWCWSEPTDRHPLGRWVAPPGAKQPGIAAVGAAIYCEHPSTEVLTVSYDLVDGRGIRRWKPGEPLPWDLMNHLTDPTAPIEAHNAFFEMSWVEKVAARLYGWPVPDVSKWRCSMATALVAQRPAALGNLGDVLGLTEKKDKEGDRLIKKFCIPQQPIVGLVDKRTGAIKRPDQPARRIYPHDDPEDFEKLRAYCDQDVRTEMAAMERLPPLSPQELEAWQATLDQNTAGLAVDRDGLRACIKTLNQVIERYGQECIELTGFKVTQLAKIKQWCADRGLVLPDFKAATLQDFLSGEFTETYDLQGDVDEDGEPIEDDPLLAEYLAKKKPSHGDNVPTGVNPDARRAIELRVLTGSASVKKTFAIEARCSDDNRLRDIVVHHGTRPGRPTGQGPQPLNLPKAGPKLAWCECGKPSRPSPTCPWCGEVQSPASKTAWQSDMVDHVLEIMSLGSLDMVEQYYGDAMTAIQGCVRGLFVAGPGKMLVSTDYSSLQAVVLACLAGEQWRIDAFKRNDPIYLLGASKITGKPLQFYLDWFEEHGDHHVDRQKIGKVSELACLGGDTLVRVCRNGRPGWQKIRLIKPDTLVWDGAEWVAHGGVIWKGERAVVTTDGIVSTPDHQFRVGKKWKTRETITSGDWTNAIHSEDHRRMAGSGRAMVAPVQNVYDIVNCGPRNRFLVMTAHGPVLAHNCGFQGWIGSYRAFGSDEEDSVIRSQILAWRDASPAIVEMWGGQWRGPPWRRERAELYGLEGMFIAAVQNPGQYFDYRGIGFMYDQSADCLEMLLPPCDGHRRPLRYHEPRLTPSARNPDELSISYMTWNTNVNYGARGWVRMPTWGGRLTENAVMGVEVNIQRFGAKLMATHGYPLVLSVYDENVAEVPIDKPLTLGLPPVEGHDPHVQEIEQLLSIMPPELEGWPIRAADGWAGQRYRKG